MDKLRTSTGREFDSDYIAVIPNPKQAYIRICNASVIDIATVFSDPIETLRIWHGDVYLSQYTNLVAIIPETGAVKIVLSKE